MATSQPGISVMFAVPPDRARLVAEIMIEECGALNQFCEINSERGEYRIEVYPRQDGKPWNLPAESVVRVLERALRELAERSLPIGETPPVE